MFFFIIELYSDCKKNILAFVPSEFSDQPSHSSVQSSLSACMTLVALAIE